MISNHRNSFFYNNGLSIVFLAMAIVALGAQTFYGWRVFNDFLKEYHLAGISFLQYFGTGHFLQSTFENWESEFLQMTLFILLTIFLKQKGSSESKKMSGVEEVDRKPQSHDKAPWPVKAGGFVLAVYKHSLSLALMALFLFSFYLHWFGSNRDYNFEQDLKGAPTENMVAYLANPRLWFESFQNWQSEFLSVFAIIFLSIYLREYGSPQSKPVDAPNEETGE